MVIEKAGRERDAAGQALGLVGVQQSVLCIIAYGSTDGEVLGYAAGQAQVVVRTVCRAIDLVVPVGAGRAEQGLLGRTALGVDYVDKFVIRQHVRQGRLCLDGLRGAERGLQPSAAALLGGDDDDTVRGTRTVDGRGGSIFQDGHALDIVRVDEREEVAAVAADATRFQGYAIQYNERVVGGRQGGAATDADGAASCGRATGAHDLHAAHLAVDELLGRGYQSGVEVIALHVGHRAGQVALTGGTIADDHYVAQHLRIGLQFYENLAIGRYGYRYGGITHVRNLQFFHFGGHLQHEVSIQVGNHAGRSSLYRHTGSNQRQVGFIHDLSRYLASALGP